jgi:hypothetical protein
MLNARLAHLLGFHTLGMSYIRLAQSLLVMHHPRCQQPYADNIASATDQHDSISSRGQPCQDSGVGIAQFQTLNAMTCQYFWHLLGVMESVNWESSSAVDVCSGFGIEYYQLWDTDDRHTGRLKYFSMGSCWMHTWLVKVSPSKNLILRIPRWVAHDYLTPYSVTVKVWEAHQFTLAVRLNWELCYMVLYPYDNIPAV